MPRLEASVVLPRTGPARARRPSGRPSVSQRYWAFLSYAHEDSATADWLHAALERFRVPPALVGRLTEMGPVPSRLTPIFRDRHELAAAHSLSDEIEEAIAGSRFLLVLCSPAAAQSRWVNEEIACFKKLQSEERVLAAIVAGEPFASDLPGRQAEECFPPALRTHFNHRGLPTSRRAELVAADIRDTGDGRRAALLKIVAGMLGVGLDELVQREEVRRHRRTKLIVAASVAGMLFTTGLSVTALQARDAARDQRREAEGLIGFMLGDLRDRLEPIGRLDVLDSVGARVLGYYEKQDTAALSDAALAQRSQALTLMGEMANARGDLDGALRRYRQAEAGTAEALRRKPDVPDHLFNHAQNVFWVGYIDRQRGKLPKAEAAFREYRRLADRMVALAPDQPKYRLEQLYADSSLGAVLMDQRRNREAGEVFQRMVEPVETLAAQQPGNVEVQQLFSENLAWLADAREKTGQLDEATGHRQRQLALLLRYRSRFPEDTTLRRQEMSTRRALARLLAERGAVGPALAQYAAASAIGEELERTEPANTEWLQASANANFERAELELAAGRTKVSAAVARSACETGAKLLRRDRSVDHWRTGLRLQCLETLGRVARARGDMDEALRLARQQLALARTERRPVDRGFALAAAETSLGEALAPRDPQSAKGAYQRALAAWPGRVEVTPRQIAAKAILLRRAGRGAEAQPLAGQLATMGYRDPAYLRAISAGS
ncbi:TIR domain-containing protein [Sphingomonas sp. GCM10030256]|uniref:TIR domain-containing protein n=1 Tax=Sphingomonas sp. GCM10030256 TaxID=3273427 RepID=UPI003612F55D